MKRPANRKKPVDLSTFSPESVAATQREHVATTSRHARELAPLEALLQALEKRALEIVRRGAAISGYPRANPFYDKLRVVRIKGPRVKIQATTYVGGGDYEDRVFYFPTAWLSMPDDAWKAELAVAVAAGKERKAAAEEAERRAAAEKNDAWDRAQYDRLKARYERAE